MNTRTKHTPGPWHVESAGPDGARVTAIAPVAWCGNNASFSSEGTQAISPREAAANARLIAAAPDMLEALRLIQNQDLVLPADREIIKAAIAKATGEAPC